MGLTLRQYFDSTQKEDEEVVGTVVDVMDPLKLGRIRVRIPGMTDDKTAIPTKFLPWMNMKRTTGTGTSKGVSFAVPAKNTKVLVKRTSQDDYQWTVTNELMTSNHKQLGLYQGNYPKIHGSSDADNSYYTINMAKHEAYFHHQSNTDMKIKASGTTIINVKDDLEVQVDDHGKWVYDGWLNTTVKEWRTTNVLLTDTLIVGGARIETVALSRTTSVGINENVVVGGFKTNTILGFDVNSVGVYQTNSVGGYQTNFVGGYKIDTVGGYSQEIVGVDKTLGITGAYTVGVGGDKNVSIVGDDDLTIGGKQNTTVANSRTTVIGDKESLTVNGQLTITCEGGVLSIISMGEMNLASASVLNISASETVNIIAPNVNII